MLQTTPTPNRRPSRPASNSSRAHPVARVFSPRVVSVCVAAVLLSVSVSALRAQTVQAKYNVTKNFKLVTGGNVAPVASHVGNTYTTAKGDLPDDDHTPLPPDNVLVPGTTSQITSISDGPVAVADANSRATVDGLPVGGPVTGKIQVLGSTETDPNNPATSKADSKISVRGFDQRGAKGNFITDARNPVDKILFSTDTQAQANAKDPISFELFDLDTGELFKGTLLEFFMEMHGPGNVIWDSGGIVVDAQNFSFSYDLTSVFVVNPGKIDFVVTGGLVTTSSATGVFTGLSMPTLGSTGIFNIGLGEVSFDYNLGDHDGHALDISFGMEASGAISSVPEPGTIAAGMALGGFCLAQLWRRRVRRNLTSPV